MRIKDSVAVVTGGASGLGEATVRYLIERGGKAVILDLNEEAGEKLLKELGDNVIFVKTNVASEEDVQVAVDKAVEVFGKINIVVNCAGIGTPRKVLDKNGVYPIEQFNKIIQVNLIGAFNVIRLAAEKMVQNVANEDGERGVVINTASVAAFEGQIGQSAYSASKGGVVAMTLPLAREFARQGIRVLTVAPGLFETPLLGTLPEKVRDALGKMVPFPSRLGKASEYAQMVGSIVSNPMVNGTTIRLDGAIRMQPK